MKTLKHIIMKAGLSALLMMVMLPATAQHKAKSKLTQKAESDTMLIDSARIMGLTKDGQSLAVLSDSAHQRKHRDWATWKPEPKRALWLALVLPGAGQIYNRKYWKLPIFYGGFVGCAYALRWNNMMYRDYSQAYLDIMDNDPTTESYNKFCTGIDHYARECGQMERCIPQTQGPLSPLARHECVCDDWHLWPFCG